jgi:hypothetical protein
MHLLGNTQALPTGHSEPDVQGVAVPLQVPKLWLQVKSALQVVVGALEQCPWQDSLPAQPVPVSAHVPGRQVFSPQVFPAGGSGFWLQAWPTAGRVVQVCVSWLSQNRPSMQSTSFLHTAPCASFG